MTKEEKIIAQAFTGICFVDGSEMGNFYAYAEKKLGHGVFDLMLAHNIKFWNDLKEACRQDFIDMLTKQEPSLPSNLDEAAEEYQEQVRAHFLRTLDHPSAKDAFKNGAKWMAGQGVTIEGVCSDGEFIDTDHGILSFDEDKRPFDDGDKVNVQIRKK